jgi:hypothetical protein
LTDDAATSSQPGNHNAAVQVSMWEGVSRAFRLVAGLSLSLDALTGRLRLEPERSWETGLGTVDVALFSIANTDFALSRHQSSPRPDVHVWVGRDQTDLDRALDVLLAALGLGRPALTFRASEEAGFVDLRDEPEP